MRGRRRKHLVVAASAVALLAAALVVGALRPWAVPQALGPGDSETSSVGVGPVGDTFNVILGGFYPHGADPVHVEEVQVTDFPEAGLRLVGVYGVENAVVGYSHGALDPEDYVLRPVTAMVFKEGEPETWRIAVVVEALRVGDWRSAGIDIKWRAGRHHGMTHFDYRIGMRVEP